MSSDVPFNVAHMDDIITASRNKKGHYNQLHKVFARIRGYGFRIKGAKCSHFVE